MIEVLELEDGSISCMPYLMSRMRSKGDIFVDQCIPYQVETCEATSSGDIIYTLANQMLWEAYTP